MSTTKTPSLKAAGTGSPTLKSPLKSRIEGGAVARVGIRQPEYEYWKWLIGLQKLFPHVEELAVEVDFHKWTKEVVVLYRNGGFCRITIPDHLQEEDALKFLITVIRMDYHGDGHQRQKSGCPKA
jgi:hypothetical protein